MSNLCSCSAVTFRADSVGFVRPGNDGRYCRYGSATGRGRYRVAFGHFLDRHDGFVHNRGVAPSARVLLHHILRYILVVDPVHVLAVDTVLDNQPEHRHVGHARGTSETDQKGNGSWEKGGRRRSEEEQAEIDARIPTKLGPERRQRGGFVWIVVRWTFQVHVLHLPETRQRRSATGENSRLARRAGKTNGSHRKVSKLVHDFKIRFLVYLNVRALNVGL